MTCISLSFTYFSSCPQFSFRYIHLHIQQCQRLLHIFHQLLLFFLPPCESISLLSLPFTRFSSWLLLSASFSAPADSFIYNCCLFKALWTVYHLPTHTLLPTTTTFCSISTPGYINPSLASPFPFTSRIIVSSTQTTTIIGQEYQPVRINQIT